MEVRNGAAAGAVVAVVGDWIRNAWLIQILIGLAVVTIAIWQNSDESKYIPVVLPHFQGETCDRAFANVLAFGIDEEGAIQCCSSAKPAATGPCVSTLSWPLVRRMTSFPEAWVFPLLPWFYRLIWDMMEQSASQRGRILSRAIQRLALYMCIMMFRGWILYVGLNAIEESVTTAELLPTDEEFCWYKTLLRNHLANDWSCYGRMFDFSDHVVFFNVQVLAIVLTEFLDVFITPTTASRNGLGLLILSSLVVYLHVLVYMGTYKTARWFHTGSEILTGWCISLIVTIPLALWQSGAAPTSTGRPRRSA